MIGWQDYLVSVRMRAALEDKPLDLDGTPRDKTDFYHIPDFMDGIRDGWGDEQLGTALIPVSGMKTVFYRMGYSRGMMLWKRSVQEGMNKR